MSISASDGSHSPWLGINTIKLFFTKISFILLVPDCNGEIYTKGGQILQQYQDFGIHIYKRARWLNIKLPIIKPRLKCLYTIQKTPICDSKKLPFCMKIDISFLTVLKINNSGRDRFLEFSKDLKYKSKSEREREREREEILSHFNHYQISFNFP